MSNRSVLVTETHLEAVANAIRAKNGGSATYTPAQMAPAIRAIEAYPEPTGSVDIAANGTHDVKDYAEAVVDVQPTLQAKTVTANGTVTPDSGYDGLSRVVVNVPTDGGGVDVDVPQCVRDFAVYIGKSIALTMDPTTSAITIEPLEYSGYVYGRTAMIDSLGLVLLGDFSQGGEASGNVLSDSIENYSAVLLQGIYKASRTSNYNTTMQYAPVALNTAYWAGMKDRNNNYDCNVTFTDGTHCDLTGNKQVIIYGMP